MPCTLLCAFLTRRGVERHAAWPGFYRRGATGAMTRQFSVALRQLNRKGRHSATGLMARTKVQRVLENTLDFFVAKISKARLDISNSIG